MNVLFAHDHILRKFKDVYYTSGGLNQEVLNRYIRPNDKIYVYTRMTDIKERPEETLRVDNENIICEPSNIYHNPLDYYLKYKDIKNEAIKRLNNIDFCVIRLPSFIGGIVYKEVKRRNIPYIVEVVACAWDSLWYYGNIKAKLFAPIVYYKTKKEIKDAKNVIYVTQKFLQERYPTNGNQVGCSDVSLPNVNNKEFLNNRKERINKNRNNKIILGTIGNVDVRCKGHKLAFKAISKLKKQGYNIEYQLIGGGRGEKLKKLAQKLDIIENVKFMGIKPHEEIFDWLDNLDIYIQSSFQEGLCRAIVEAMSRACPCIVSNVGGNSELINEKYIFKKGDVKRLYSKLLLLINSKENMEESSKQNYTRSLDFEKEKLEAKRKKFYNAIIGE